MGAQDNLSRKTGVIVGDDVLRLFEYAREKQFAIPAIVCQLLATFDIYLPILAQMDTAQHFERRQQTNRFSRMSPPPPLPLLLSRLPVMPRLPSSSRCPRVVPLTSPAR
jgi:hypothetical protein